MVAASSILRNPSARAASSHSSRMRRPTPLRVKAGCVYMARTRAASLVGSNIAASRPGVVSPPYMVARRLQPPHPANKADFFSEAVHDAVDRVGLQCPEALVGITFGIEDVPHFDMAWSGDQVPLAAAVEGTANQPGQVVVYRRPLEHRAVSRRGLRILVYRTIVEQLSALTGRSVEEIDPDGAGAEDD